jgi:hypothetical protein
MPNRDHFPAVFARLKGIFQPFSPHLLIEADAPDNFVLNAPPSPRYPKGLYFGGVRLGKRYVSYHLMPVYIYPDLLDDLPERLRKRMPGKSCFNFSVLDEATVADLTRLTAAGFERYRQAQLLPPS